MSRVVSIDARRTGYFVLLSASLPGRAEQNLGLVMVDPDSGRRWVRIREQFDETEDPDGVFEAMAAELPDRIAEAGVESWLAGLEDSLSNAVLVSGRQAVSVDSFARTADRLFAEHVEPIPVEPFQTHLPLYSLRAAAGALGDEMGSEVEDWVRVPEGVRADKDLFVAHVVGRSMEPRIPDGSLNLFRWNPVGSRQNKILLIQRFGAIDETSRYTVKKYTSRKLSTGEDQWEHERIRLEPLNPEFEAWDVGPRDFAVVAEWLRVIE